MIELTAGILLSLSLLSSGPMSGDEGIDLEKLGDDFFARVGAKPVSCGMMVLLSFHSSLHTACGESTVSPKKTQKLVVEEMRRRDWSIQGGWAKSDVAGMTLFEMHASHDGYALSARVAASRKEPALLVFAWEEEWPPAERYKDAVRPIYMTDEVTPPKRTFFIKPDYPEDARSNRQEGRTVLEIVINKDGDVQDLRILKSNALFDQAAVKAVKRWRYTPAVKDKKPVPVFMTIVVEFNLK